MGKVAITLQSSLVTKIPRENRKPTIYRRTLKKLIENKKHPGRIFRIYAHINDDFKTFGAITFNTGGSISFFPDFYKLDNFDHLTLNKDFINKKGHLTKVEIGKKNKKTLYFEANKLPTGDFHIITFAMTDGDMLMDSLPEVGYPELEFDGDGDKFLELLKDSINTGAYMLDFPEEDGFYCIQIQAIPKGKDINTVSIESNIVKSFLSLPKPLEEIIQAKKLEIDTPEDFDFSLCVIAFRVNQEIKTPFGFVMAQDPDHKEDYKKLPRKI